VEFTMKVSSEVSSPLRRTRTTELRSPLSQYSMMIQVRTAPPILSPLPLLLLLPLRPVPADCIERG
jgi:hypothetical protein